MANEPVITICGNATADAEMRVTQSGVEVTAFTVAVTPRVKSGDDWTDGESTFYRCYAWRQMAEPVASTITKGMRLLVQGRLKTRSYEKDGQTRLSIEIDVDEVGPSLRYATAKVTKNERGSSSSSGSSSRRASSNSRASQAADDDLPPF